jgi:hypothetical protein
MQCISCETVNPAGTRTCLGCGKALTTEPARVRADPAPSPPSPVPPPPPQQLTTTRSRGLIASLVAAVIALLVWLLADWRRAAAAGTAAVVLLGGLWWWNSRPASRSTICGQAVELRTHIESSSGQLFDNAFFTDTAALGASASKPDPAAGGDLAAVRYAGAQLVAVGGRSHAGTYEVEGPLQTIEQWCVTSAPQPISAPAPAVPEPAPADTTAAQSVSLPGAFSCDQLTSRAASGLGALPFSNGFTWEGPGPPPGMATYTDCSYEPDPQLNGQGSISVEAATFDSASDAQAWLTSNLGDKAAGLEGVPSSYVQPTDGTYSVNVVSEWSQTAAVIVRVADPNISDGQEGNVVATALSLAPAGTG